MFARIYDCKFKFIAWHENYVNKAFTKEKCVCVCVCVCVCDSLK